MEPSNLPVEPAPAKGGGFVKILIATLLGAAVVGGGTYAFLYQQGIAEATPKGEPLAPVKDKSKMTKEEQIADLKSQISKIEKDASVPEGFRGMALGKLKGDLAKLEGGDEEKEKDKG
jgi:hypothetical protein